MEQYRFKYYWTEGYESFREIDNLELSTTFMLAHLLVQNCGKLKKIDVYKGGRLISTFYK